MRILIAPDKFKGALSAYAVAEAIARGIRAVAGSAEIALCPMADGGEGTVDAMLAAMGGERRTAVVVGPLPAMRLKATYAMLSDRTAVIEMSAASGLALVPTSQRNPMHTTTFGTGELLRAAAEAGARKIILGIGGSATTDGGIGALQALGVHLFMRDGSLLARPAVGADLEHLSRVVLPVDWRLPEILIACDVENPLCGASGAAAVFGPQKGASPNDVHRLDTWLARYAEMAGKVQLAQMPGAGAAGGLGFGLCAFVPGVRMAPGFDLVARACGLEQRLMGVDLCITGEGRLDSSSPKGKTAAGVARCCARLGVKCVVLAGSIEPAAERELAEKTGTTATAIADGPMTLEEAMARTAELLERAASRVARLALGVAMTAGVATAAAPEPMTVPASELGRRVENGQLIIRAKFMRSPVTEHKTRQVPDVKGFEPSAVPLSKYGGWATEKLDATGFFHAKKIGDRWWIIDPEGYRFLHMAVVSVSPGNGPQMKRAFAEKFVTKEKWRDDTMAMLKQLGFNGTGSWTEDALLQGGEARSAYTPLISFMSAYGKKKGVTTPVPGHQAYPNRCIPVFDPEFIEFADQVAQQCAARKDDPWLLGWFSDNELPFPKDALKRYLELPEDDHGRKFAEAWLKERNASPEQIDDAMRETFAGVVMDRYLSIVSSAIRKYDPNHMYLGPRFYSEERGVPATMKIAGKYIDVLGVNIYGNWDPGYEAARIEKWAGKPIIVTEWYAKGMDTGLPNTTGAGWLVATQEDRAAFYEHFTLSLLEMKASVGWHWFKYLDNDPEDTKAELSNRDANKGMLTVKYEPHEPLVRSMKRLNESAYRLTEHFDKKD